MGFFKRGKPKVAVDSMVQTVPMTASSQPFSALNRYIPLGAGEMRLYDSLREGVPIIDAAICKIVRLIGGFYVKHDDSFIQTELNRFITNVKVNGCSRGIESFISIYIDQLLTYGTAVGEIVPSQSGFDIAALYNASLSDVELKPTESPLRIEICSRSFTGISAPVEHPELILISTLNPKPGAIYGESILKGLPFVSGILLKIYNSIGLNWERIGNVRFAVTYKPSGDQTERSYAQERAMTIAKEWSKAMQSSDGRVSDFVAVGDVNVKVIGADNQILDSQVPVKQMLEQIVAKLSIPPFLLGLSWSTTERMSSQQADILTSELEAYRRILSPVISNVCSTWLKMHGYNPNHEVVWENINLQDEVELANARLLNAKAKKLELLNKMNAINI